jgi:hypothetical protein
MLISEWDGTSSRDENGKRVGIEEYVDQRITSGDGRSLFHTWSGDRICGGDMFIELVETDVFGRFIIEI